MFASLTICDFRRYRHFSNKHNYFCFILEVFTKQLPKANHSGWEEEVKNFAQRRATALNVRIFRNSPWEFSFFINDNLKLTKRLTNQLTDMNTSYDNLIIDDAFEASELWKLIELLIMASTASKLCKTLIIYRNFQIEFVSICSSLRWQKCYEVKFWLFSAASFTWLIDFKNAMMHIGT